MYEANDACNICNNYLNDVGSLKNVIVQHQSWQKTGSQATHSLPQGHCS